MPSSIGAWHHHDGRPSARLTLVCATGFDAASVSQSGHRHAGAHPTRAWASGPEAYRGITVAGFPNMFLMLGPNAATGHTSTLLYIEPEVAMPSPVCRAYAPAHRWIDVKPEVMRAYNDRLQSRLGSSVWAMSQLVSNRGRAYRGAFPASHGVRTVFAPTRSRRLLRQVAATLQAMRSRTEPQKKAVISVHLSVNRP